MEQFKDGSHRRLGAVFMICFLVSLTYHVVNVNIIGVGDGWRWRLSASCNNNIEIEYIRVGGFGLRRVGHLVASVHPDSDLPFLVFYTNEI